MKEDKIVVIKVKCKTRERLKRLGNKGETYEDVITRMFADGVVGDGGEQQ